MSSTQIDTAGAQRTDIFEQALERGPEEQESFLASACGRDADLRREVESLLAAHQAAGDFIARPAIETWLPALGRGMAWQGRRIGPYTVLREIGRGGMSRVFLATRSDREYEARVAIKVMAPGPGAELLVERFRRERQILANLDHPNIARLLDGGTLPDGLPYVVMDYVEGVPIDEHCARERLSIDERLRLFCEVCSAVQHAHGNLVVHRDLKPANVLVTAEGSPKLLDFGIAKLLEPGGDLVVTRTRFQALTPQYASPEQMRGEAVTTASDVYSLGVILYELLTERLPYEVGGVPFPEVARRVAEQEPRRPSAVAATPLRRRLAGDLDKVVLKALRKDPTRRYPSVEQLAEDLRRHLAHLPVSARPDTFAYRAAKFWRRHRIAAPLAAAALAAVLALSAVAGIAARRAARERDKAEQALAFMVDVFRQADPMEQAVAERASELTVREALDAGSRRVSRELAAEPELRAMLLNAIGESYLGLGLPGRSRALHEEALALAVPATGRRGEVAAAALHGLGAAHLAAAEYAAAERRLRQALALRQELLGRADAATIETVASLAGALRWQERNEEAEALLRETLELARRDLGSRAPEVATLLEALADLRWHVRAYAETEALRREVVAIRRAAHGPSHPRVAKALDDLGAMLTEGGKHREAAELHRRARAIWLPLLPADHPALLANLNNLAGTLLNQGRYREAAPMYRRLVARRRALQGERHSMYVTAVNNLATLESDRGNWAAAARLYEGLLPVARETFGEPSLYVAGTLLNTGFIVRELGELDRAERLDRAAFSMLRELYGDGYPLAGRPLLDLGRIAVARGDLEAGEGYVRDALELWRRALPPGHRWIGEAERELGVVLLARGRYAEAEPLLLSGYLDEVGRPRLHGTRRLRVLRRLVDLHLGRGDAAAADRYRRELESAETEVRAQGGLGATPLYAP